jgi:hypothetical protein
MCDFTKELSLNGPQDWPTTRHNSGKSLVRKIDSDCALILSNFDSLTHISMSICSRAVTRHARPDIAKKSSTGRFN